MLIATAIPYDNRDIRPNYRYRWHFGIFTEYGNKNVDTQRTVLAIKTASDTRHQKLDSHSTNGTIFTVFVCNNNIGEWSINIKSYALIVHMEELCRMKSHSFGIFDIFAAIFHLIGKNATNDFDFNLYRYIKANIVCFKFELPLIFNGFTWIRWIPFALNPFLCIPFFFIWTTASNCLIEIFSSPVFRWIIQLRMIPIDTNSTHTLPIDSLLPHITRHFSSPRNPNNHYNDYTIAIKQ